MKKIFVLIITILFVCSCGNNTNSVNEPSNNVSDNTATIDDSNETSSEKNPDTSQDEKDVDLCAQYANSDSITEAMELVNSIFNSLSVDEINGVDYIDFKFLHDSIKVGLYDEVHCVKTGYWNYGDESYRVNQWYDEVKSPYIEEIHDENGRVKIRRYGLDTFYYTYKNGGEVVEIDGIESQIRLDAITEKIFEDLPTVGWVVEDVVYDDEFRETFPLACLGLATLIDDDDIVLLSEVEKAVNKGIENIAEDLEFQYTWTQIEYDDNNNRIKELWSSKEDRTPEWIFLYDYNKDGLPIEEAWEWTEDQFKKTVRFEYDANKRLNSEISETGSEIISITTYFYNETGDSVAQLDDYQGKEYPADKSLKIKKALNRKINNEDLYTKSNNGHNRIFLDVFREAW